MRNEKPRILVMTGPGKGKTTAALGVILRSLSYGKKVLLIRFAKSKHSGELTILEKQPGMKILNSRVGMTPPKSDASYPDHKAAAKELFRKAERLAPEYDLIVLDEICGLASRGVLSDREIVTFAAALRPNQSLILTGRGASPALIAVADTVSEIVCLKHCYAKGIPAQEGIEL